MYLDEIMGKENTNKMTPEVWDKIAAQGSSFFDEFPFFNDPKFVKLNPVQQKLLLAYTLKGVFGYTLSEAYLFATGRKRGSTTTNSAARSARAMLETSRLKYFVDKIDWTRVERLGFTANKIIEAETEIAHSDITAYLDDEGCFIGSLQDLPGHLRRAIKSFEVLEHYDKQGNPVKKFKIQLWDKGASLQRIEKIKGMHIDVVNSTNTGVNITGEMSPTDAAKVYSDMMKGENQ